MACWSYVCFSRSCEAQRQCLALNIDLTNRHVETTITFRDSTQVPFGSELTIGVLVASELWNNASGEWEEY